MPIESALGVVAQIIKGEDHIRNCSCHRALKLLEHGIVMERVLKKASYSNVC